MYFVYLLQSLKDNHFYIGQTDDTTVRLRKHNRGEVRATLARRPFKLLGYVTVGSRREALALERTLKSHSDRKKQFIRKFVPEFEWGTMKKEDSPG